MLIVAGTMRIPLKDVDKVKEAMPAMVEASRAEEGCLVYTFAWDTEEANLLRVFEIYKDQAALAAHRTSEHMRAWLNVSGHCVRDINRYDATLLPKM